MKAIILFFSLLFSFSSFAQIEGSWKGDIEIPNQKLPFVIHISTVNNELKVMGESPMQTGEKFPLETITFRNDSLKITDSKLRMNYTGVMKDNHHIEGKFQQQGMSFKLNLEKGEYKINRPQEPQPPFNYQVKEVTFNNREAGITLAGTLTMPNSKGKFPAVILVSGSGPQDRNEEILGHKPFFVLADYLTKNGYAVLRYDDRGVNESSGNFANSTTADFATDAEAALNYLQSIKEIDSKKIGILGHSEGGIIAQMIAANNKDLAFIISMAGPTIEIDQLMLKQKSDMERAMGVPELALKMNEKVFGEMYNILKKDISNQEAESEIKAYLKNDPVYKNVPEKDIQAILDQTNQKWFREFISYNPASNLSKIKTKVLAINGEKDVQVTAKENLEGWKNGLVHNKKVTIKSYPNLNHLFQKATTGMPNEYGEIETTIEPIVLEDIVKWLNENVK